MTTKTTKERLMDAAESLFAENGFASTSLRAITSRAGVNLAAVNFHFGTKHALLSATLERRVRPISQEQLEELRIVEDLYGNGPVDLGIVLRALIKPILNMHDELGEAGDQFLVLAGQAHRAADKKIRATFHALVDDVMQKFLPLFERALPLIPRQELQLKLFLVFGMIADVVEWRRDETNTADGTLSDNDTLSVEDLLLRFAAAGMRS